ncbi:MAG: GAF domain-containing sensor histidine kinase [Acidobacteria bacterium]|nr:GAF domain-containing sensor histidine kinase [Acidobacteriota bacterium]
MSALAAGQPAASIFEQVEYHGRRLAKLNLPPSQILDALEEYDGLLTPAFRRLIPEEYANFQWVREQLHFCVILTLNNAYYQVREDETQAFYELFRVELESRKLDELLERFLETLALFCRADAAHLFLREPESGLWLHRATLVGKVRTPQALGDAKVLNALRVPRCWSWRRGKANGNSFPLVDGRWGHSLESCWSIPLMEGSRLGGVMQFGFRKVYEWLPREQELLAAAAERCLMAAEKARLVENLAKREEQIRSLAEHMLQVEEAERRRISRELHDEAGQSLLCVRLQLEMIEQAMPPEAAAVRRRLEDVREQTERTILEIRRLIAALSPAVLEQLGLGAALRQLVNRFGRLHAGRVKLHLKALQGLPKQLEIIVYRLVQECCNNIAKHSLASHVNISAATADGLLRLQVEDDGIGFHVKEALEKRNSFGLAGIRERVALMGGKFAIESWPKPVARRKPKAASRGTRIRIELPIPGGAPRP